MITDVHKDLYTMRLVTIISNWKKNEKHSNVPKGDNWKPMEWQYTKYFVVIKKKFCEETVLISCYMVKKKKKNSIQNYMSYKFYTNTLV